MYPRTRANSRRCIATVVELGSSLGRGNRNRACSRVVGEAVVCWIEIVGGLVRYENSSIEL